MTIESPRRNSVKHHLKTMKKRLQTQAQTVRIPWLEELERQELVEERVEQIKRQRVCRAQTVKIPWLQEDQLIPPSEPHSEKETQSLGEALMKSGRSTLRADIARNIRVKDR